jgi:hypothetical protein
MQILHTNAILIINTCKTNQLITVNVISCGQSNFTIENGKLTIGGKIVSFVVIVSVKYTLKWVTCIKRSHFSCPLIENFIWIEPLLRGHLSLKTTLSLSQRWPRNTDLTVSYIDLSTWTGLTLYTIDKRIRELYNRQNFIFNYELLIWYIMA